MRRAAAGAGPLLCLAAWLLWALTNGGWIGEIPALRTLAHHAVLDLLVLALLALAWVVLMMTNLLALRHPATRSRARTQVLVLALAAVLALALPSRALTMFRVWHADFVQLARTAPGRTDRLSGHWKFGTVTVQDSQKGGAIRAIRLRHRRRRPALQPARRTRSRGNLGLLRPEPLRRRLHPPTRAAVVPLLPDALLTRGPRGPDPPRRCARQRPAAYFSARRALRNIRSQGLSALVSPPLQLICTLRSTRSGCGISAVTRPSAVVTPVRPPGLPLGLKG